MCGDSIVMCTSSSSSSSYSSCSSSYSYSSSSSSCSSSSSLEQSGNISNLAVLCRKRTRSFMGLQTFMSPSNTQQLAEIMFAITKHIICIMPNKKCLSNYKTIFIEIDECALSSQTCTCHDPANNPRCTATCHNTVGSYRCSCSSGYRLDATGKCIG